LLARPDRDPGRRPALPGLDPERLDRGGGASTGGWLAWRDPALLAERYRMPGTGGQSRRDRRLVYAMAVGFLLWVALMPLDGGRFHWTPPLPRAVAVVGGVCLMLGWCSCSAPWPTTPSAPRWCGCKESAATA
jgi:hypothetical protein